jgi:SPX domain protein involved in polyphosphate accumulation
MIEIANNDDLLKVWNGSNDDYFVESLEQELDYCYTMAE